MTIKQIDELIERLTELIDFAESNIWEVPIDMPDTLDLAITGLEELREAKKRNEAKIKAFKEMMKER